MNKVFIDQGKEAISLNNVPILQRLYDSIKNKQKEVEYQINFQYIYQKLLYYACIKEAKDCIIFLLNLYLHKFDDVSKIALRQSFFYGKYLLKDEKMIEWYDQNIISKIRK
tara:strand:+ start:858 stop:1190 length:333 start_codon:yes stop_codon:yes gene_type:complete